VIEKGQIVIGNVMNVNFVVDHRYVDGGKCTKLVPAFRKVMEEPELFLKSAGPSA
jgi:pyruvate/2-oxoglutarate dehydrogenase complex dihydrolipoamide acyltransferase (E2) component